MEQTFFDILNSCVAHTGSKAGTVDVDPAVWQAFTARPAPPPRPAAPPVQVPSPAVTARPPMQEQPRPVPVQAPPPRPVAPPVQHPRPQGGADWESLAQMVHVCNRCRLCKARHHTVFGEGNPHAELMFVGEGPGQDEDMTGRPFVGKAGQLLDKMIAAMTYRREDVYIANVVKCRPPNNRAPSPDEARECFGYLRRQIELVNPKAIVSLGGTALTFLLGETVGIRRMRGRWINFEGIPVMPTFHPAYLLRSPDEKKFAWYDLQEVMRALGRKK